MEKLLLIQSELKAPKNQYNSFGKYKYRNCEDILEAVKPLLLKHKCTLTISDKISGGEHLLVVEATATITDGTNTISVTAHAGIDTNRKGMDIAQSFGASSSYARKYALNGLFLIDDTKDADATNTHGKEEIKENKEQKPTLSSQQLKSAIERIQKSKTKAELDEILTRLKGYELTEPQQVSIDLTIKNKANV